MKPLRHVVILVHGIGTYGGWQERLANLLYAANPTIAARPYKYGYFSLLAFVLPVARLIETFRFRRTLRRLTNDDWDRIDIVAHSFGTHIAAHALRSLPAERCPKIHTLILAGSMLRSTFAWDEIGTRVSRVVNECGTTDSVLLLSQVVNIIPPFTGMAGRVGFFGLASDQLTNRFHPFGHSGYFMKGPTADDGFMQAHWVPMIATEAPIEAIDMRPVLTPLGGLWAFLLNNASVLKVSVLVLSILAAWQWYHGLSVDQGLKLTDSLIAQGATQEVIGNMVAARRLYAQARSTLQDIDRPTAQADFALYHAYSNFPPALQISQPTAARMRHVAVQLDGRIAATIGVGPVQVWDLPTGLVLRDIERCGQDFTAIAFVGDQIVALGDGRGGVTGCDVREGRRLWFTPATGDGIAVIVPARDGPRIAVGGTDGSIRVIDSRSGSLSLLTMTTGSAIRALALSPGGDSMLSADDRNNLQLWNVAAQRSLVLEEHSRRAGTLAFSKDGRMAIAAGGSEIGVWAVETGRLLGSKHIDVAVAMANDRPILSSDGAYLLASMREGVMVAPGEQSGLDELTLFAVSMLPGRSDGSLTLELDKVWRLPGYATRIADASVVAASSTAVLSWEDHLEVWDAKSRLEPVRLPFGGSLQRPGISGDGLLGIATDPKRSIGIYDLATFTALQTLAPSRGDAQSVALTQDGRLALVGTGDGHIDIWDVVTAKRIQSIATQEQKIVLLAIAPDGSQFASIGSTGRAETWSLPRGLPLVQLSNGAPRATDAAYSPDLRHLAVSAADGNVNVWDVSTGRPSRTIRTAERDAHTVSYSPDGSRIMTTDAGAFHVWKASSGSRQSGSPAYLPQAAFLSDRRWAAVTAFDRSLKIWNLETDTPAVTFEMFYEGGAAMAVDQSGKRLWTSSAYGQNLLWRLDIGARQQGFESALISARTRRDTATADWLNKVGAWYALRRHCEWAAPLFEAAGRVAASTDLLLDRFQCFVAVGKPELARQELERLDSTHSIMSAYLDLWRQRLEAPR